MVGGLFCWGNGWIGSQSDNLKKLIPLADIIITSPSSLVAGIGILLEKWWGTILGLLSVGMYVFGSVQVYLLLYWNLPELPLEMALPPIFGIGFSIFYMIWVYKAAN